ncbi:hypothetical protein [Desulfonatronum thiosulfatophilum]|nr:hypothetical protein [Desulfonatronum thiosulfatophilum]
MKFVPVVVLIVQVLMGWGLWSLGRKFMPREECERCRAELEVKLQEESQRTNVLDKAQEVFRAECSSLPTKADLGDIYDRINSVNLRIGSVDTQVAALGGEMRAQRRTLDMINQHLMRGEG